MAVLILTLLSVFVGASILFILFNALTNYRPGKRKVQEDIKKMRQSVEPWIKDLVPISREELEQFSQSQINQLKKKRMVISASGVFTTIYHEPLVAYSYKKYISKKYPDAILYARTADHEYIYRIKNNEVKLLIDNQPAGILNETDGVLYAGKKPKMIAKINRTGTDLVPVIVNQKEVGNLSKALPASKSVDARAFEFIKDDMNEEEMNIFLSLAIYELVKRNAE